MSITVALSCTYSRKSKLKTDDPQALQVSKPLYGRIDEGAGRARPLAALRQLNSAPLAKNSTIAPPLDLGGSDEEANRLQFKINIGHIMANRDWYLERYGADHDHHSTVTSNVINFGVSGDIGVNI